MSRYDYDLCVIGAGSGGLVTAAGAAQMGARVLLVEGHRMGGDCLNTGCVPSKALLASAKAAIHHRHADALGAPHAPPAVDFGQVMARVRHVIDEIAPMDSAERMQALGVTVRRGWARFAGPDTVTVEGETIRAKYFVIATGGKPIIPPIAGLEGVPYLTNESMFDLRARPDHLIVLGAGPIGCEMAQAFARLGVPVTQFTGGAFLPREDRDAAALTERALLRDGVTIIPSLIERVEAVAGGLIAHGGGQKIAASHILIAAGRKPNLDGLECAAAGIALEKGRLVLNAQLRTTNPRVYAIGDAAGGMQFTHLASHQAGLMLRRLLFRLPVAFNPLAIPRVTFTDPEIAAIGLDEEAAFAQGPARILRAPMAHNDRNAAEGHDDGFVKIIVHPRGRVLGATLVGHRAGELLPLLQMMIARKIKIGALAGMTISYPTQAETLKRAAGQFYAAKLFNPKVKALVQFLLKLP